jgi:hypothetical protein
MYSSLSFLASTTPHCVKKGLAGGGSGCFRLHTRGKPWDNDTHTHTHTRTPAHNGYIQWLSAINGEGIMRRPALTDSLLGLHKRAFRLHGQLDHVACRVTVSCARALISMSPMPWVQKTKQTSWHLAPTSTHRLLESKQTWCLTRYTGWTILPMDKRRCVCICVQEAIRTLGS